MPTKYDLIRDYGAAPGKMPVDPAHLDGNADWALGIVRLANPNTFSRATFKSIGQPVDAAGTRGPLLIIRDQLSSFDVETAKDSHTPFLTAQLRSGDINLLNPDVCLPGDWVLCWASANREDLADTIGRAARGEPANRWRDGLKFLGRLHSVRSRLVQSADGNRSQGYAVQAVGFEELDTNFFYDFALATHAAVKNEISTFMAQLGLDFSKWASQEQLRAGDIKDNADVIVPLLIDAILGKGIADRVNDPSQVPLGDFGEVPDRGRTLDTSRILSSPQHDKSAPYSYLVPTQVGMALGRDRAEATKGGGAEGVFGYADILDTLIGVQSYTAEVTDPPTFYPQIDPVRSTASRHYSPDVLKGTFLPVEPVFVNKPLWGLLNEYLNPAINEMYVALKPDRTGSVVPTLVMRQIPFSTESIEEDPGFPLTRFMDLPRWVLHPTMVTEPGLDIGRGNATRVNMVHVYGEALTHARNMSVTDQLTLNPPIFDAVDTYRSGMRPIMRTVNCSLTDEVRPDGAGLWMRAIADWSFGSQYTLNGTVTCMGIQAPIAPGDNLEFEGIVYHVESVHHHGAVGEDGTRFFRTTLRLSNGMPANQDGATADFPVYAGFVNSETRNTTTGAVSTENFAGDPDVLSDSAPGQNHSDG